MPINIQEILKDKKKLAIGGGAILVAVGVIAGAVIIAKKNKYSFSVINGGCKSKCSALSGTNRTLSFASGKYLSTDASGNVSLTAGGTKNEQWVIEPSTRIPGRYQLKNVATGLYFEANQNQSVDAKTAKPNTFEAFDIQCRGGSDYAIMGFHGRWVGENAAGNGVENTDVAFSPSAKSIVKIL